MKRNLYRVESRPGTVYNAANGTLSQAHVVIYEKPHATGGRIRIATPGTWTRAAARHIAKTMNGIYKPQ